MAEEQKTRIINLAEKTAPDSGDFFAVDSQAGGSKKIPTTALAKAADLTAEAAARTQADNALTGAINSASALIQNPTKTLSGALCSFTDGADMPMVACTASIVPKQSGTGTPSPDNVRPISGWESVKTSVTGVNVWDEEWKIGAFNTRGEFVTGYNFICSKSPIRVFPNTAYTTNTNILIWEYDADMNIIRDSVQTSSGTIFTTSNNAQYINFRTSQQLTTYNHDISINYPSTDHDYHAYTGTTTTVNLGRTVYGGTLDVVSGVLTDKMGIVDLGTLNWTKYNVAEGTLYRASINTIKRTNAPADVPNIVCSHYPVKTQSERAEKTISQPTNNSAVDIIDSTYADATSFKSAMSGVQLVYELATPQTYTLTGQEVSTLLGENNVWADSGDVEITYRRDISIVLENLENAING